MSQYTAEVSAKTVLPGEAAGLVKSGMWIDLGAANTQPELFDKALAERVDELSGVKIRGCLSIRPLEVMEADPEGEHFYLHSWHFSGYDRVKHDAGRCVYIPLNLGEVPDYYRRFITPPDIAVIRTAPAGFHEFFWANPCILFDPTDDKAGDDA